MTKRTERIIQFGEGGFLRGFVDWMLQIINENTDFSGSAVVVQPIPTGMCGVLNEQGCVYNHICRGAEGIDMRRIDIISRCINPYDDFDAYLALAEDPDLRFVVSNTTEAGIAFSDEDKISDRPAKSFPAKVTQLLYKRFTLKLNGFVFLPCELIDRNGDNLKRCILNTARLWELGKDFEEWLEKENVFCNTLVDRINTGFPKGEEIKTDFEDKMLNASEYFHLWVIEGYNGLNDELPFDKCGLNVILTDDLERYRTRKVRILNGAHTSLVAYALLSGIETVKECIDDPVMLAHLKRCIFDEIIPTLDLTAQELEEYANDVIRRFSNPYIKHYLASISLNSISKFKVRVLPSITEYIKRYGKMPEALVFSLAKLIEFYKVSTPNDDPAVIEFIRSHTVKEILANEKLWDEDISYLTDEVIMTMLKSK